MCSAHSRRDAGEKRKKHTVSKMNAAEHNWLIYTARSLPLCMRWSVLGLRNQPTDRSDYSNERAILGKKMQTRCWLVQFTWDNWFRTRARSQFVAARSKMRVCWIEAKACHLNIKIGTYSCIISRSTALITRVHVQWTLIHFRVW